MCATSGCPAMSHRSAHPIPRTRALASRLPGATAGRRTARECSYPRRYQRISRHGTPGEHRCLVSRTTRSGAHPVSVLSHRWTTASQSYDRGMDAQTAFDLVAAELSGSGATTGKLFGHPALKLNGSVFASEFYGAMAFKLGRETSVHAEALLIDGATL